MTSGMHDGEDEQGEHGSPPQQPGQLDPHEAGHAGPPSTRPREAAAEPLALGELEEDRLEVGADRAELGQPHARLAEHPGHLGRVGRSRRGERGPSRPATVSPAALEAARAAVEVGRDHALGRDRRR